MVSHWNMRSAFFLGNVLCSNVPVLKPIPGMVEQSKDGWLGEETAFLFQPISPRVKTGENQQQQWVFLTKVLVFSKRLT